MATPTPPYTMTNDSITVVWEGKPHVVQRGSPQFTGLRKVIIAEKWNQVPKHLTIAKSIKDWAKGKVTLKDDTFFISGTRIPADINSRIVEMATKGEDPTPLFNFWERLQRNPSMRSVEQLWPFLMHKGIPLTKEGRFLAYKGVQENFKDAHTGTIDNKPGMVNKMPRNQISDDPNHACHEGFHVGALSYAQSFSKRVIICEVDPEHVVCVPYDSSQEKMRVCEYTVKGLHNGSYLPSTTYTENDAKADAEEEAYDPENDFLAEPCEECGSKIPMDYVSEDNRYHDITCTKFEEGHPLEEEKKKPAKKKKGVEKKKEHKALKKAGKQLAKSFSKLKDLTMPELMGETIDTLRDYAGKGLKIVGASKIPGGKTALVAIIMKARN